MGNLIQLEYGESKIWVESTEVGYEGGLAPAGAVEAAEKNIEKMLDVIKPFCESLRNSISSLGDNKPNSYSAEFGLNFSGEGNVFFAKVSGEATVKVTANWGKE
jgi:hypothetical protein